MSLVLKVIAAAIGVYLILPGPEDFTNPGITFIVSFAVGAALLGWAFGIKLPVIGGGN